MNRPEIRAIPCGSSHGSGTAASVAKLYGILANGGVYEGIQVLSEKSISALETPAMTNVDQMVGSKLFRGIGTWLIPIVLNDNFDEVSSFHDFLSCKLGMHVYRQSVNDK